MEEIDKIKQKIIPILKLYGVSKAGIFGSYARGENNKKSDLDILIKIEGGTDLIELIKLRRTLQRSVKKKVDIVEYSTIRLELRKEILNDEIKVL